jgi:hypothetical protein
MFKCNVRQALPDIGAASGIIDFRRKIMMPIALTGFAKPDNLKKQKL